MIKIEKNGNYVSISIPETNESEFDISITVKSFNLQLHYDLLVEKEALAIFKKSLQEIQKNIIGECEICQRYEPNFIKFKGTKTGHLLIEGQFVDFRNEGNECKFNLEFDQTFIPQIIEAMAQKAC